MNRYAEYGRYSIDLQNDKSTTDQSHDCREYVKNHGGVVVATYQDKAKTGTNNDRHRYQKMLDDAAAGKFNYVVAESLDRLTRNLEDAAQLYNHLTFYGVKLVTVSEGEIDEMKLAWLAMAASKEVKERAHKVRRGMKGIVREGRYATTPPYGYRLKRDVTDEHGDRVKGLIEVDEREAQVVQRIFEEYAAGKSPVQIARDLNSDGIPGPKKGMPWQDTAIRGNRKWHAGILNNQYYIGIHTWNRTSRITNPKTKRKVIRLNPESEWVKVEIPKELVIISSNLWLSVKARQQELAETFGKGHRRQPPTGCRRNRYFLSGLLFCGECGDKYILTGENRYGCSGYKLGKGCANNIPIKRQVIEKTALRCITEILLDPKMVDWFLDMYMKQIPKLKEQNDLEQVGIKTELKNAIKRRDNLLDAIETGINNDATRKRFLEIETEIADLESRLVPETVIQKPSKRIISAYRKKVQALHESIYDKEIAPAAQNDLRLLIDKITLHPDGEGLKAKVDTNMEELLSFDEDKVWHFF